MLIGVYLTMDLNSKIKPGVSKGRTSLLSFSRQKKTFRFSHNVELIKTNQTASR
jgi:hypothetical protein